MNIWTKISLAITTLTITTSINASLTPIKANPEYQWDMMTLGEFAPHSWWSGDNFVNAWKTMSDHGYIPGHNVVVAIIDSGYTPHQNFINNLQTFNGEAGVYGYQFISDCRVSGECEPSTTDDEKITKWLYKKNGVDRGDYVDEEFIKYFSKYELSVSDSLWFGTSLIGIIIGSGYNNGTGIAGGAYGAKVIPIRVYGRGGVINTSVDVLNGMLWAAGFEVTNMDNSIVPINQNPAQVINLSFSIPGTCPVDMQNAINKITDKGIVIVAGAGNNQSDIANYAPANCNNVISVAAKTSINKLAFYSNYGTTTIAASAGNSSRIYSASWSLKGAYNSNSPVDSSSWSFLWAGTGIASAHVTAAAANLISILKARNQPYTPKDITNILQKTATKYKICGDYGCAEGGALDMDNAVKYVLLNKDNFNHETSSDSNNLAWILPVLGGSAVAAIGGVYLAKHRK